jgi:hypothetical protein
VQIALSGHSYGHFKRKIKLKATFVGLNAIVLPLASNVLPVPGGPYSRTPDLKEKCSV